MSHRPVRGGALEFVGGRFLRDRSGQWLDLATGLQVDVATDAGAARGSTSASVTRDHVAAWVPLESTVVIARMGARVIRFSDGRVRSVDVNADRAPPSQLVW